MTIDAPGVGSARTCTGFALELTACGVVGTDGIPGHAETSEAVGQQPGSDVKIHASIVQIRFLDAESGQLLEMSAVDLHQPDVVAAGSLLMPAVHGARIQIRLRSGDGIEKFGCNPIALCRRIPAGLGQQDAW